MIYATKCRKKEGVKYCESNDRSWFLANHSRIIRLRIWLNIYKKNKQLIVSQSNVDTVQTLANLVHNKYS